MCVDTVAYNFVDKIDKRQMSNNQLVRYKTGIKGYILDNSRYINLRYLVSITCPDITLTPALG
jgi:hypothetical protein